MPISLSAEHIVKRYGGVVALSDANLSVQAGEVVALLGANGSGKSTLSKIISGVVAPNGGQLLIDGQPTQFAHPQAAKKIGIATVFQELSLIPDLTVAENIWLTHEPLRFNLGVNRRELRARTRGLLDLFGGTFGSVPDPDALITDLTPDVRQIVEILKAISREPRLIILDEATASLDSQQVQRLFDLVRDWKKRGIGIVFVSHRMDEIFRIADRTTVLRNGRTVGNNLISAVTERDLVQQMIEGAAAQNEMRRGTAQAAGVRLQIEDLHAGIVNGVSLTLHDGELLGVSGLQGQGQTELLLAVFGALPFTGRITLSGEAVHFKHPGEAMKREIAFVPGDRASEGLLLIRSILENFQLPSWRKYGVPLSMGEARRDAGKTAADLNLIMAGLDAPVSSLSGGNAQKVVIGKWLLRKPKLLLLNDPTKGIDVGAKAEFYALLNALREAGTAILFYSSDDEELLGLCDRVIVLHDGKLRVELAAASLTRENLVAASMGTT